MNQRTTDDLAAFVRLHTEAAMEVAEAMRAQGVLACERSSWGNIILGVQMLSQTDLSLRELVSVVTVTHVLATNARKRRKAN